MTVKKTILIFCLLSLTSSLLTCVDVIDFTQAGTIQESITIQGRLTKGNPSHVAVQISKIFNFREAPRLIDVKYVELIDDTGNKVELISNAQGIYKLDLPDNGAVEVVYGKGYQIKTEFFNGQIYESSFDTLYPVTVPMDLTAQKMQKISTNVSGLTETSNIIAFNTSITFPVFDGRNIDLLWNMESTFKLTDSPARYLSCQRDCEPTNIELTPKTCFVTNNPDKNYKVLNTSNLSGNEVTDFNILTLDANSFIFSEGFYLTVLQQSLSEPAQEYWSTVAQLTNRSGSVFEAPAGRITSNFRNITDEKGDVFGYFYATESVTQRIYISPSFAGFPNSVCPRSPRPDGSGPGNCCNCLCEGNSTTKQPEWWVE